MAITQTSGHDEVSEVGHEDKDPSEDHCGRRVQIAVLHGSGGHCKVGCDVPKPFRVREHVISCGKSASSIEF